MLYVHVKGRLSIEVTRIDESYVTIVQLTATTSTGEVSWPTYVRNGRLNVSHFVHRAGGIT
jgi:hypothetical protein